MIEIRRCLNHFKIIELKVRKSQVNVQNLIFNDFLVNSMAFDKLYPFFEKLLIEVFPCLVCLLTFSSNGLCLKPNACISLNWFKTRVKTIDQIISRPKKTQTFTKNGMNVFGVKLRNTSPKKPKAIKENFWQLKIDT